MKSILKSKETKLGSNCTLSKLPLRVSFALDQHNTQKDSLNFSQVMSWDKSA
jgi:hypothetical protein